MSSAASTKTTTLDNLQAAFNGESNARASYLAFAAKADQEGYAPVASLFRAAARAEEIHARNHAGVIAGMGAAPVANIETPAVKSTRENLRTAIKGELYENEEMYPAFLKQARHESNDAAVDTFYLACEVEAEHARLYTKALNALDTLKGAAVAYYVCPVCGFTAARVDFDLCPVCSTPGEQYEEVQ